MAPEQYPRRRARRSHRPVRVGGRRLRAARGALPWRGIGRDGRDGVGAHGSCRPRPLEQPRCRAPSRTWSSAPSRSAPSVASASIDDVAQALDAAFAKATARRGPRSPRSGCRRARPRRSASRRARSATCSPRPSIVKRSGGSTKLGFEDLLAVAAEVGIDPESLREASRALRAGKQEASATNGEFVKRRDAWIRQQRLIPDRHAGVYVIVNAAILVLGLGLLASRRGGFGLASAWLGHRPGHSRARHLTASDEDFREHERR